VKLKVEPETLKFGAPTGNTKKPPVGGWEKAGGAAETGGEQSWPPTDRVVPADVAAAPLWRSRWFGHRGRRLFRRHQTLTVRNSSTESQV